MSVIKNFSRIGLLPQSKPEAFLRTGRFNGKQVALVEEQVTLKNYREWMTNLATHMSGDGAKPNSNALKEQYMRSFNEVVDSLTQEFQKKKHASTAETKAFRAVVQATLNNTKIEKNAGFPVPSCKGVEQVRAKIDAYESMSAAAPATTTTTTTSASAGSSDGASGTPGWMSVRRPSANTNSVDDELPVNPPLAEEKELGQSGYLQVPLHQSLPRGILQEHFRPPTAEEEAYGRTHALVQWMSVWMGQPISTATIDQQRAAYAKAWLISLPSDARWSDTVTALSDAADFFDRQADGFSFDEKAAASLRVKAYECRQWCAAFQQALDEIREQVQGRAT